MLNIRVLFIINTLLVDAKEPSSEAHEIEGWRHKSNELA